MPLFTPPKFSASAGTRALKATSPAAGIYNAQFEQLRSKRALANGADPNDPLVQANRATGRAVIETSNPMYPARAASTQARRRLISGASGQNQMQRNYLQQSQGMDAAAEAERQGIVTASHDVGDLTAVAQATGHRNAINNLRDAVGIPRDIAIDLPQGDNTPLPVGVTKSLRSNAAYLSDASKDNEGARNYEKGRLKSAIDIEGTNLQDLRSQSQLADMNLDEATQGAGYRDKLSGQDLADNLDQLKYGADIAGLDLADQNLLPAGYDLWENPDVPGESSLVSKAEKDRRDYAYSLRQGFEHIPAQYSQTQARTQYGNQQGAEGSATGYYTDAQLLNTLPAGASIWQQHSVFLELVRRYRFQGAPEDVAAQMAQQAIQQEMGSRRQTATGYDPIR